MLIKFTCENFLSFGDKENAFEFLNTAASKTKSLPGHVVKISPNISVLRGAVIYGANASGKTNFIKAINYAKNIIESPEKGIEKHNLTSSQNKFCKSGKSKFVFEFKLDESIYEYGFEITSKEVVLEWLCSTSLNGTKAKTFFKREGDKISNDKEISKIVDEIKKEKRFFEKYSKKAVKINELLLHRLSDDGVKFAQDLIKWFGKIAIIRGVKHSVYFKEKELSDFAKTVLKKIDWQINDVSFEKETLIKKPSEISGGIPNEIAEIVFNHLLDGFKENKKAVSIQIPGPDNKKIYLSVDEKGVKQIEILIKRNGKEFTLDQESDGIRRIFDLIPMLFSTNSKNSEKLNPQSIFIIDEIEKSLHPCVARDIINMFFKLGKNSENQIIFTTHDTNLLDLSLLRKDEIWFAEKDENLNTHFTSLVEFKNVREDLIVSKGYLQGRFGAIPFIRNWMDN
ncbi:MAG: AAA15 family ATPase/GTPase [Rickettsiales bacterium]|jgi:AAA15 family ATPase/GTPase